MEERSWNNEFLARCGWPRELFVDGRRILVSDANHAAYWDEHGENLMLADSEERHAMELALLPDAEQFADLPDADEGEGCAGNADAAPDIASLKQADALAAVAACESVDTLREWMLATGNNQVKGAIRRRLAEVA